MDINPKEDNLSYFANWYLTSGKIDRVYTPINKGLLFIEGVNGIVLYRHKPYQVELFICKPNLEIPEHYHPDVDSYELFLYGMRFTHSNETVISDKEALEEYEGMPLHAYRTIRVKPNDIHGGKASKHGGAFISIQHWLNDVDPTHVSSNWDGKSMGKKHLEMVSED